MVEQFVDDAKRLYICHWRAKSEELRSIAEGMKNDYSRRLMLNAAANYDRLADEAEERDRPEGLCSRPATGKRRLAGEGDMRS